MVEAVARAARELERAERGLGAAVARARAEGATWQQVAEVLGVSRQAAFKRFGHAVDPATGEQLVPAPTADVAGLAVEVFEHIARGEADLARERMTQACARELTRGRIEAVWREVVAGYGALEELSSSGHHLDGEAVDGHQVPLPAVGRVELRLEAGECWGHVLVNRDGRVSGMVVRPGGMPETWPL
ncbi:hypothetical protein GCM10009599_01390 [Luteococcus peritonei]